MDLGLKGKVAFVTGASGDIGAATAVALAREGAAVAVGWHSRRERAAEVAALVEGAGAGATACPVRVDQADPVSMARAVDTVRERLGPVDVLVANAVAWPTQDQDWDALVHGLTVNAAGTMTLAETVIPDMRESGWGRIVLVSSCVVEQPAPAAAGYPAAKAAIEAAARVLALREARHGILTNAVRPGFTLTERALTHPGFGQELVDAESAKTPTGRICTPEDVAGLIAYLASDANGHVNGEVVSVAGGRHLTR
ncbi:SDR family NAD(P)-dependent oxidoreductase [Streptomyces odontomachi]|uniref:SDR family NAD(P)-dependent oxidoreductase n=1 Tax=Streptomyces odontomachi TaxID=2944940 RepID=UPI00210BD203|nr:SDR family oxidoreductase [Streptomyces sp. ODS25]